MSMPAPLPVYFVKLSLFETLTGYTPNAVHGKIKKGVWRQGVHYVLAEDGNILMDLRAYHAWAESQQRAA